MQRNCVVVVQCFSRYLAHDGVRTVFVVLRYPCHEYLIRGLALIHPVVNSAILRDQKRNIVMERSSGGRHIQGREGGGGNTKCGKRGRALGLAMNLLMETNMCLVEYGGRNEDDVALQVATRTALPSIRRVALLCCTLRMHPTQRHYLADH